MRNSNASVIIMRRGESSHKLRRCIWHGPSRDHNLRAPYREVICSASTRRRQRRHQGRFRRRDASGRGELDRRVRGPTSGSRFSPAHSRNSRADFGTAIGNRDVEPTLPRQGSSLHEHADDLPHSSGVAADLAARFRAEQGLCFDGALYADQSLRGSALRRRHREWSPGGWPKRLDRPA